MLEKLQIVQQRFDEVSDLIIQPDIIADQKKYIQLNKEYKDLSVLIEKIKVYKNIKIKSFGDHRIAMSFSILNLLYDNKLKIDNKKCINISYPDFTKHLNYLL